MGGNSDAAGSALANVSVSQAPTPSQQRKQERGESMASSGAAASGLGGRSLGAAHRFEFRLCFFKGPGWELRFKFGKTRLRDPGRRGAEPVLDESSCAFEFLKAEAKEAGAIHEREPARK